MDRPPLRRGSIRSVWIAVVTGDRPESPDGELSEAAELHDDALVQAIEPRRASSSAWSAARSCASTARNRSRARPRPARPPRDAPGRRRPAAHHLVQRGSSRRLARAASAVSTRNPSRSAARACSRSASAAMSRVAAASRSAAIELAASARARRASASRRAASRVATSAASRSAACAGTGARLPRRDGVTSAVSSRPVPGELARASAAVAVPSSAST
jgi:hypothetical protein